MRQLKFGCEEVEEERARVGGDAVVLCLWLNVEPVRLRGDQSMRCAASGSIVTIPIFTQHRQLISPAFTPQIYVASTIQC